MYFLGTYDYSMDQRGRVPLPPRYRELFTNGVVLSQGIPDNCIRVYTFESYESQARQYASEPAVHRRGRVARRGFFPRSFPAELDRQGRVLVPPALRRWANLDGNVVVTGNGEWLEIWDPQKYEAEMAAVDEEYGEVLETLEQTT